MKQLPKLLFGLTFLLCIPQINAQEVTQNNQDVFNEFTYRQGNSYRSASALLPRRRGKFAAQAL